MLNRLDAEIHVSERDARSASDKLRGLCAVLPPAEQRVLAWLCHCATGSLPDGDAFALTEHRFAPFATHFRPSRILHPADLELIRERS